MCGIIRLSARRQWRLFFSTGCGGSNTAATTFGGDRHPDQRYDQPQTGAGKLANLEAL